MSRVRPTITRSAQPQVWLEAGSPDAQRLLVRCGLGDAALPVVVDGDET